MSMDRSLKSASSLVRHRNVLTRAERLDKLAEEEKWTEKKSVFGLPKVAHRTMPRNPLLRNRRCPRARHRPLLLARPPLDPRPRTSRRHRPPHRPLLGKLDVVGIRGSVPADEARLGGNKPQMVVIALTHGFADDHFDRLRQQVLDVTVDEVNAAAAARTLTFFLIFFLLCAFIENYAEFTAATMLPATR